MRPIIHRHTQCWTKQLEEVEDNEDDAQHFFNAITSYNTHSTTDS